MPRHHRLPIRRHVLGIVACGVLVAAPAAPAVAQSPRPAPPPTIDGVTDYPYHLPHRYLHRDPEQPAEPRLRWYRRHYPWSNDSWNRLTHPHTYNGQFGLEPDLPKLTLRHYQGPGNSIYGRYQHLVPPEPDPAAPDPAAGRDASPAFNGGRVSHPPVGPVPRRFFEVPQVQRRYAPALILRADRPAPPPGDDERDAWRLLHDGRHEAAQYRFAAVALAHPDLGRPRAGWALSVALQGDLSDGVFSMRRAVVVDDEALAGIETDAPMQQTLRGLLERYQDPASDVDRTETLFMCAALHRLLGELETAESAVRAAIEQGDWDRSTLELLLHLREAQGRSRPTPARPDLQVRRPTPSPPL